MRGQYGWILHECAVVFSRNESLFVVSAAATSAFQLKHTPRLLRSICPGGYEIRTIEYGKIFVMLCCSMGNTIGAYTRYIINCCYTVKNTIIMLFCFCGDRTVF